ncbi:nucleotide-binding universal stress UspA family protein [Sinobaca qinghaiensis]|uniref:Nucleotide-binding universal stress UspA family protein n=1 Tax=Sinobaca qinghaiensis TaxID=342944 RepID=A0A419UX24_9BACL|nr:universal stress protein [Sinobaca qinghaiensis]RKD69687.1 nucleotide-binding universal stress UspA family protein [Sinobaca qinghaiensis]
MKTIYKNILIAVDGSEDSEKALEKGINLTLEHGSTLIIGHVVDYKNYSRAAVFSYDLIPAAEEAGQKILDESKKKAQKAGVLDVITSLQSGNPQKLVSQLLAENYKADLIITGASGAGTFDKYVMGSVSLGTVRHAQCDVLIVRNEKVLDGYQTILAAADGSDESIAAFEKAVDIAAGSNSSLIVAHVLHTPAISSFDMHTEEILAMFEKNGENILEQYKKTAEQRHVENIKYIIERGSPKTVLPISIAKAYKADLIVAGASGLNRVERRFLGSVAESIVRRAACDVLIVHPPD